AGNAHGVARPRLGVPHTGPADCRQPEFGAKPGLLVRSAQTSTTTVSQCASRGCLSLLRGNFAMGRRRRRSRALQETVRLNRAPRHPLVVPGAFVPLPTEPDSRL